MTRIWERLFIGGFDDAEALAKANPNGITAVLTVCPTQVQHKRRGIAYLHFAVADEEPMAESQFEAIIDAIAENIRWGVVLVNCVAGASRSPILAGAWMDVAGYKNIDAALAEIERLREIDPTPILLNSVKEALR